MEGNIPPTSAADAGRPQAAPPAPSWRVGLIATGVFLTCLAVYHANGRPHPEVDCVVAPYTAWSILRHGSLDLSSYPELARYRGFEVQCLPDGTAVAGRPLGSAVAALPFLAPLAVVRERPPPPSVMLHLGKLAAASYAAGAVVVFFFLCRRLAPAAVWPATTLFALGTCLWSVASQALWMHAPATFWTISAMYLLTGGPERRGWKAALGAGLAFGLAILTRPTTALFAAASGCGCLSQRRWRDAAGLLLGAAGPLLLLLLPNYWYFGNPIAGGYVADDWRHATALWIGLPGLLVAPSRGLLVYSPALLLAPLGLFAAARAPSDRLTGTRGMLFAWAAASAATVVFYARWHDWAGGWCYGPRFLCETLPAGCLLFALGYAALRRRWQRGAAAALVALSVMVQFVGVFGHGAEADWYVRHPSADQWRCLFALRDTQIEAEAWFVLQKIGAAVNR